MRAAVSVFFVLSLFRLNFSLTTHYLVTRKMTWQDAQTYCRDTYDDLSTVSKEVAQLLSNFTAATYTMNWIGLYRNPNNSGEWIWSGGEEETTDNWDKGQPENDTVKCGGLKQSTSKFHDVSCSQTLSFYCMKVVGLILVRQNKTWDKALDYCRQKYTDLASLNSETIMAGVINNTTPSQTDYVWTGLRFMAGRWFWVNGDNLQYKAWSEEGELRCPAGNLRCGALDRKQEVWKPTDCEERHYFLCFKKP